MHKMFVGKQLVVGDLLPSLTYKSFIHPLIQGF